MSTNQDNPTPEEPNAENQVQSANGSTNEHAGDTGAFDIGSVVDDAKRVILNPVDFYKTMPQQGGLVNPMLFVVVMALATWVLGWALGVIGLAGFNAAAMGAMGFIGLIIVPIGAILASFIGAAILFVIWRLMGSTKSYETAYRCLAYTFAIMPVISVLSIIPYIANIVKSLWMMGLLYLASIHVHDLKESSAKIVFGILAALLVISGIKSENTARKYSDMAERYTESMEREFKDGSIGNAVKSLEDLENMTPEEAGEQFGKFLKGMEQFAEGMEEEVKKQEEEEDGSN